jgi:hypothetical protein
VNSFWTEILIRIFPFLLDALATASIYRVILKAVVYVVVVAAVVVHHEQHLPCIGWNPFSSLFVFLKRFIISQQFRTF